MSQIIQIKQTTKNVRVFSVGTQNFFIEDWNKNQTETNLKTLKKNIK